MPQYKPSPGAQFSVKEAQIIGRALEQLGEFSPQDVVDHARPTSSPLHKFFEWNDGAAAARYRLFQARNVVNHIQIVVRRADGSTEPTKAFHSIRMVSDDSEGEVEARYVSIRVVSSREADRDQVIQNALRELEGWKERYQQYRSLFGGVFTAIREAKANVERNGHGKRSEGKEKRTVKPGADRRCGKRSRAAAAANQ